MGPKAAVTRLAPADELDLRPVFQPVVDLRDGAVVGYEALRRAGKKGRVATLDLAARDAALRSAEERGLDAPLSLFLNADPATLDDAPPERPASGLTLLVQVTEEALLARPEAMLRALTRLRSAGWGIALDEVGGDPRSLALMSMLYPDVIRLDLRVLAKRAPADVARIVTAVGAEAERRRATVLAAGIDADELLASAHAFGATVGQGDLFGAPAALPDPLPAPGRPIRLPGGAGDPFGPTPWERVTNWRRPCPGSGKQTTRAARMIVEHAAELGRTAMVLVSLADESFAAGAVERYDWLPERVGFVGVLNAGRSFEGSAVRGGTLPPDDPLRGTATLVALAPDFAACFVARQTGEDEWQYATTYDRDTVLECALPLLARIEPPAPPKRTRAPRARR